MRCSICKSTVLLVRQPGGKAICMACLRQALQRSGEPARIAARDRQLQTRARKGKVHQSKAPRPRVDELPEPELPDWLSWKRRRDLW